MATQTTLVTGLVKTHAEAETAARRIIEYGYARGDVILVMNEETRRQYVALQSGTQAAEGATVGGVIGGTLGAVLAGLLALGTVVVLPGIGLVVAGPIAAALAGA